MSSPLTFPLPAYVINMDSATERWSHVTTAFAGEAAVSIHRQPGIVTSQLPRAALEVLTGSGPVRRGALGCFLAHCAVWESIAGGSAPWTLLLEDDSAPRGLARLLAAKVPADADIIWTSVRADPAGRQARPGAPRIAPLLEALRGRMTLDAGPAAFGTDGYLLSREGAVKLLGAVRRDGFSGHVDWRLVRYSLPEALHDEFKMAPWFSSPHGLNARHDGIGWGILNAYACSPAVTRVVPSLPSQRKLHDSPAAQCRPMRLVENRPSLPESAHSPRRPKGSCSAV